MLGEEQVRSKSPVWRTALGQGLTQYLTTVPNTVVVSLTERAALKKEGVSVRPFLQWTFWTPVSRM